MSKCKCFDCKFLGEVDFNKIANLPVGKCHSHQAHFYLTETWECSRFSYSGDNNNLKEEDDEDLQKL